VAVLKEQPELLHVLLAKFGHDGPKLPAVIDSAVRFIEPAEIRPDALFEGPEIPWMGLEVQGDKDEDKHRSAISVGAFKLFGGGSTKQGAGIVVGHWMSEEKRPEARPCSGKRAKSMDTTTPRTKAHMLIAPRRSNCSWCR
jgi:hypothetical protein